MLNSKKITIGDKEITVCEVKVKRVLQLLPFLSGDDQAQAGADQAQAGADQADGGEATAESGFMQNMEALLFESTGMSMAEFGELHGSDVERLWAAFREVNGFFFKTIQRMGLEERIKELIGTLLSAYGGMYAGLLGAVTGDASNMDLVGLLQQFGIPAGSAKPE